MVSKFERDDSPPLLCIDEIIPLEMLSALGPQHKNMDLFEWVQKRIMKMIRGL